MLGICEKIWKCSVPSVPGINGASGSETSQEVRNDTQKQGGMRGFFYSFVKCCGTETGTGTVGTLTFDRNCNLLKSQNRNRNRN